MAFYREETEGVAAHLPPTRPYGDYIAWLERQDQDQAEAYWRHTLKGFTDPTALALPTPAEPAEAAFDETEILLSETLTARLTALAQACRVTLNTVIQGLWGPIQPPGRRRLRRHRQRAARRIDGGG